MRESEEVSKAQSDSLLKRTRNCLIKSVSVVRVFVCVFERVAINIVLFFGCANKIINPLYFFIISSWS